MSIVYKTIIETSLKSEVVSYQCNKCSKVCLETIDDSANMHNFQAGGGYGNTYPGDLSSFNFTLCSECLEKLVESFSVPIEIKSCFEERGSPGAEAHQVWLQDRIYFSVETRNGMYNFGGINEEGLCLAVAEINERDIEDTSDHPNDDIYTLAGVYKSKENNQLVMYGWNSSGYINDLDTDELILRFECLEDGKFYVLDKETFLNTFELFSKEIKDNRKNRSSEL